MATKSYVKRTFLNKDRTAKAFIIADAGKMRSHTYRDGSAASSLEATLCIGDCVRNVTLDFNIYDPKDKANVLHKARIFREVINNFLDTVEAEADKSTYQYIRAKKKKDGKTKKAS